MRFFSLDQLLLFRLLGWNLISNVVFRDLFSPVLVYKVQHQPHFRLMNDDGDGRNWTKLRFLPYEIWINFGFYCLWKLCSCRSFVVRVWLRSMSLFHTFASFFLSAVSSYPFSSQVAVWLSMIHYSAKKHICRSTLLEGDKKSFHAFIRLKMMLSLNKK